MWRLRTDGLAYALSVTVRVRVRVRVCVRVRVRVHVMEGGERVVARNNTTHS